MTETHSPVVVRYLGGESGHRSFFGGTHSRTRIVLLTLFVVAGMVLTPLIGWPGLLVALIGAGITFLVTANTHRGSIVERRRKRRRWVARQKSGSDRFRPYEVGAWDQSQQALLNATRSKGAQARAVADDARRDILSMRSMPDGADGMGWLQFGRGEPGIGWHTPAGERPYLSVTFSVAGQLRGIESPSVMARAADAWGSFLASRAVPSALADGVQVSTRVLPSDTALQEFWVLNSLDPAAPADAIASYEEVLRLTGEDAMVQRHLITIKWPLTPTFRAAASKYGPSRDGWRGLMKEEIESTLRGLGDARLGQVEVLTARQTAAVIMHQQNPSRPIDYVAGIDPARFGLVSRDEFSAHVVADADPVSGAPVEWWHRTAAIRAGDMATAPRTQLWLLDLLVGSDIQCVRTVSFHIDLIPAGEAKAAARQDLVRDAAEALSRVESGQVDLDDTDVHMTAARRRREDLVSGSQHHGASWVGYITISVRGLEELSRASRQLEETCATGLGIERLDWMDSYQSAASGTTWPIGRGLAASRTTFGARAYRRLAGDGEKEAIS
jgi:hypothetical protein